MADMADPTGSVPPTEHRSAPTSAASDMAQALTITDLPPLVADIVATLKRAAEALPETRRAANAEPNPMLRQYRLGLVDGCESTIERVARIAQHYLERAAS